MALVQSKKTMHVLAKGSLFHAQATATAAYMCAAPHCGPALSPCPQGAQLQ